MDTISRSEAQRTAWGLVIANLRMQAHGPDAVTSQELESIAGGLTSPGDWGLLAGCLAQIAADSWCDLHGSPAAALSEAQETALDLAAGDG